LGKSEVTFVTALGRLLNWAEFGATHTFGYNHFTANVGASFHLLSYGGRFDPRAGAINGPGGLRWLSE
jgi:uncharacterized radical SAM superfamily Fe-S cluster-containing enzyme